MQAQYVQHECLSGHMLVLCALCLNQRPSSCSSVGFEGQRHKKLMTIQLIHQSSFVVPGFRAANAAIFDSACVGCIFGAVFLRPSGQAACCPQCGSRKRPLVHAQLTPVACWGLLVTWVAGCRCLSVSFPGFRIAAMPVHPPSVTSPDTPRSHAVQKIFMHPAVVNTA